MKKLTCTTLLFTVLACPVLLHSQEAASLPDTSLWNDRVDTQTAAQAMVEGLHRFSDRMLAESVVERSKRWHLDNQSPQAWAQSVQPNRQRFQEVLGLVDPRASKIEMELTGTTDRPSLVARAPGFRVLSVRWPVYEGVHAEGLLLEPSGPVVANVVVVPDASQTPEQVAGLVDGFPTEQQVARLMAEDGCRVVVPTLLSRESAFSGHWLARMTNLTHREWIWRQAFEMGRHPLGYEVATVSAAIDWLESQEQKATIPIAACGYGEGGLVAFYAAAADDRIDACWLAGAFGHSQNVWAQPIERDVFGLLEEFGDAEVANLIIPRGLVVEACDGPSWQGPLPPVAGRADAASGTLEPRIWTQADQEWTHRGRQQSAFLPDNAAAAIFTMGTDSPEFRAWNAHDSARRRFLESLHGRKTNPMPNRDVPAANWTQRGLLPPQAPRMKRLVDGWTSYTQELLRTSEFRRDRLWKEADKSSLDTWKESTEPLRKIFWEQLIGKLPLASLPLKVRSVKVLDEPGFTGYAVELPVWPDVVASGILLLPKDLKPGEKRPVVVCQHGLEGTPQEVVDPKIKSPYHGFGARLADLGYIVYAPQNPYIGHDRFRQLQRKLHPLGQSLFAVIIRQHERTLQWLKTLPEIDADRIAFYGLSYGGKTAMRVPAVLTDYCLSICSADFNEWVVKCTNLYRPLSYLYTVEYDMYEWNLASTFNYAEMAALIAPRPFMVERGHFDGVAPDEWIGYEFAKVKRTYDLLGLADRCEITYFNGPHEIKGEATFNFLAKHLDWPRGQVHP